MQNFNLGEVFDDKTRISKFLELLPELFVADFTQRVWGAVYFKEDGDILSRYEKYAGILSLKFHDKELAELQVIFNNEFGELYDFLNYKFFVIRSGVFAMCPDQKYSKKRFFGDIDSKPEDLKTWEELEEDLHTLINAFEAAYSNLLKKVLGHEIKEKLHLKDVKIDFNDSTHTLTVNDRMCILTPQGNEHDFCRVMFGYEPHVSIDWSEIHHYMVGSKSSIGSQKNRKSVQDTMYRLNERIKTEIITDDNLFSWDNNSIKRNF